MRLGWMSWGDIWQVVSQRACVQPSDLPAADLERLLRHKGLCYFHGFHAERVRIPSIAGFWKAEKWFKIAGLGGMLRCTGSFWKKDDKRKSPERKD